MELSELIPEAGTVRRIQCDECGTHMDLSFVEFDEDVSGVAIRIAGLPALSCPKCGATDLPDRSRLSIIELHRKAVDGGSAAVNVNRRPTGKDFGHTAISFDYDSDDYFYLPGLVRDPADGFLTPVFFNREVLIKYDSHPMYRVSFASRTYGSIWQGDEHEFPFGINRHGRLVMWLGDIARLPQSEQHYLRSENTPSDHSIGSEFYDGQIECEFTDQPPEDTLFHARSALLDACFRKFGEKIGHLEQETLAVANTIRRPVVDTPRERQFVADALNKVYVESLDNAALGRALQAIGEGGAKLGTLKRLQFLIQKTAQEAPVGELMAPMYALYDLRVIYSHLGSAGGVDERLDFVCERLQAPNGSGLFEIYDSLLVKLTDSFQKLTDVVE